MIIALLLSSLLGGLVGVSLGIYWGLGIVMTGLCYVFGSMSCAFVSVMFVMSHMEKQRARVQATGPDIAPQLNS